MNGSMGSFKGRNAICVYGLPSGDFPSRSGGSMLVVFPQVASLKLDFPQVGLPASTCPLKEVA